MTFVQFLGAVALLFIAYMLIYILVDRVCKCFEYCAMAKAYGRNTEAMNECMEKLSKK